MTRPSRRAGARLLATGLAVGACLLTAGCSPVYSPAGGLAQSASDAAAQAQTGAVTLRLAARGRLLAPAAETALSDATDKLGQDASSLTSADVSGDLSTARGRILARLRTGEDLLIQARRLVETQAGPSGTDAVVRRLQATSKALTALEQHLQASG
jgi:hypothetical protein